MQTTNAVPLLAEYLSRKKLAEELHVDVRTLARWKTLRKGPPHVVIAGRALYRRSDVAAWLAARMVSA